MAGFGFASIGHFFASVFHDVHVGLSYVEKTAIPAIQKAEPLIEGITSFIDPPAVVIERAAFQALGLISGAVHTADQAVLSNGLNVQLDAQTVAAFKALIVQFESEFSSAGLKPITTPATA